MIIHDQNKAPQLAPIASTVCAVKSKEFFLLDIQVFGKFCVVLNEAEAFLRFFAH
jgi:hypothetical protein